jgi:YD repeat-containing protein
LAKEAAEMETGVKPTTKRAKPSLWLAWLRLASANGSSNTTAYAYDTRGRCKSKEDGEAAETFSTLDRRGGADSIGFYDRLGNCYAEQIAVGLNSRLFAITRG